MYTFQLYMYSFHMQKSLVWYQRRFITRDVHNKSIWISTNEASETDMNNEYTPKHDRLVRNFHWFFFVVCLFAHDSQSSICLINLHYTTSLWLTTILSRLNVSNCDNNSYWKLFSVFFLLLRLGRGQLNFLTIYRIDTFVLIWIIIMSLCNWKN